MRTHWHEQKTRELFNRFIIFVYVVATCENFICNLLKMFASSSTVRCWIKTADGQLWMLNKTFSMFFRHRIRRVWPMRRLMDFMTWRFLIKVKKNYINVLVRSLHALNFIHHIWSLRENEHDFFAPWFRFSTCENCNPLLYRGVQGSTFPATANALQLYLKNI